MAAGLVDVLVAQPLHTPNANYGPSIGDATMDPNADYSEFVASAAGTKAHFHATLQTSLKSDRMDEGSIEYIRGAACNLWAQGVDGLYLASWYDWPRQASFYEKLREVPFPSIMACKDKVVFIPTDQDDPARPSRNMGAKHPNDPLQRYLFEPSTAQLPALLPLGKAVTVTFYLSDNLQQWHSVGRVHKVVLRVRIVGINEVDHLVVALNGKELDQVSDLEEVSSSHSGSGHHRRINEMYKMKAAQYRVMGCWLLFHLRTSHWPRCGKNDLTVTVVHRDPAMLFEDSSNRAAGGAEQDHNGPQDVTLRDVECATYYLMGRSFHRADDHGTDPDLVPLPSLVHSRM